jgi:hypothetical protein
MPGLPWAKKPRQQSHFMLESLLVKIRVLIPRYHSERQLAECLDSVLMEDFDDMETVVSHDCPADNTLKAIETHSAFCCP